MSIMVINNLPDHFVEVAYVDAILEHLKEVPDFHFVATAMDAQTGKLNMPTLPAQMADGASIVPLIAQSENPIQPARMKLADSPIAWSTHIMQETKKLRAFPLGPVGEVPVLEYKPPGERLWDVFFCGRVTPQRQQQITRWRDTLRGAGLKVNVLVTRGWMTGLAAGNYAEELMNARVALCPAGLSPESFRFYEAMRSGCAVLSNLLPPHSLYVGSPARQLHNWDDEELVDNVRELLDNIEAVSASTLEWWDGHYEPEAVAQGIKDHLATLPPPLPR
jgi:hypothetical protein